MVVVGLSRDRGEIEPKVIDTPRQYHIRPIYVVTKKI